MMRSRCLPTQPRSFRPIRSRFIYAASASAKGRLKEAEDDLRAALKLDPSGKDEQMVTVMAELGAVLSRMLGDRRKRSRSWTKL